MRTRPSACEDSAERRAPLLVGATVRTPCPGGLIPSATGRAGHRTQLLTVALVFASLHLVSRARFDPALRLTGAGVALAAAAGWAFDRLGALANPLAGAEDAVITHPWWVVGGLAVVAACCWAADRRPRSDPTPPVREEVLGASSR